MTRPKSTVQFLDFLRDNVHVYHLLVRLTHEARRRVGGHFGMDLVFNQVRWETHDLITAGTAGDESGYKLNDRYLPFFARLIMHCNPDLAGVFVLRHSVADNDARLAHPNQVALWDEADQDNGWLDEAARMVGFPPGST